MSKQLYYYDIDKMEWIKYNHTKDNLTIMWGLFIAMAISFTAGVIVGFNTNQPTSQDKVLLYKDDTTTIYTKEKNIDYSKYDSLTFQYELK